MIKLMRFLIKPLEKYSYIWRQSDYLCSKRLKAALPLWLPYYERHLRGAWIFGSRYGGALRKITDQKLCLEHDLHGYYDDLDREPRCVE